MRRPVVLVVLLAAFAQSAHAQVAQPRGASVLHTVASDYPSAGARRPLTMVLDEGGDRAAPWVGYGALGGAAAGALWGSSVNPDGIFPIPLVWAGAIAGALAGAVVGAVLYGFTRLARGS